MCVQAGGSHHSLLLHFKFESVAAPNGSLRWFCKYLFDGKEKRVALAGYAEVSLKRARELKADARKLHVESRG